MRNITILSVFLFCLPVSAKVEIVRRGSDPFLSQQQAQRIWIDIQSRINRLQRLCPARARGSVTKTSSAQIGNQVLRSWIRQVRNLGHFADQTYEKHKYSFNKAQVQDGTQEVDLALTLLDISSLLKQIPSSFRSCRDLESNITSSWASYIKADSVDAVKQMPFWAKKIHFSIGCLCQKSASLSQGG